MDNKRNLKAEITEGERKILKEKHRKEHGKTKKEIKKMRKKEKIAEFRANRDNK